jgi:hypothetical protein
MTVKTLQKTWTEIYQTFARLSALVTNAEANVCCEDLCHQINKCVNEPLMVRALVRSGFQVRAQGSLMSKFGGSL